MSKILLLEDDATEAKYIGNALKEYGYQVVWVAEVSLVEPQAKTYQPDLVVLDLDTSYANEALNIFEENPALKEIPILLLTSDISSPLPKFSGRERLKYLPKPFHPQILDLQIQTMLHEIWCQMELKNLQAKVTEYRQKYEYLTIIDELTGLFNQTFMLNSLKVEFARAVRYNKSLSLILLEVADFKRINEKFGLTAGNFVLREVGRLIKESIRVVDIASRSGESKFTLILPETDNNSAAVVVEKIRQQIRAYKFICPFPSLPVSNQDEPAEKQNTQIMVDIRFGLASFPDKHIERFDMLLESAEHSLSRDKEKRPRS